MSSLASSVPMVPPSQVPLLSSNVPMSSLALSSVDYSIVQAASSYNSLASYVPGGNNADATNVVGGPTNTPTPMPGPVTIDRFTYGGCFGSSLGYPGFVLVEDSSSMSIDQCLSDCYASAYAGIYSSSVLPLILTSASRPC